MNLAIVPEPFGWVTVTRIYIGKRDREMNEVEIEVVETPVFELFLCQCLGLHLRTSLVDDAWMNRESHMVVRMECVPELKMMIWLRVRYKPNGASEPWM